MQTHSLEAKILLNLSPQRDSSYVIYIAEVADLAMFFQELPKTEMQGDA